MEKEEDVDSFSHMIHHLLKEYRRGSFFQPGMSKAPIIMSSQDNYTINLFWRMETGHISTGFHSSPLTGASCKLLGCLANAKDLVARVEGHGLGGEGKPSNGWRDWWWVKDSTVAFWGYSGWYCSNVYREEDVSRRASGTLIWVVQKQWTGL